MKEIKDKDSTFTVSTSLTNNSVRHIYATDLAENAQGKPHISIYLTFQLFKRAIVLPNLNPLKTAVPTIPVMQENEITVSIFGKTRDGGDKDPYNISWLRTDLIPATLAYEGRRQAHIP